MAIVNQDFAVAFAKSWVDAWNRHDLEAVLSHYTDDFRFSSPLVTAIADEPSGTLRGKAAVRAYWARGLERITDLRFELTDVLIGINRLTLYYRGHRGMAAECFYFDESGRVREAHACYTVQS